MICSKLGHPFGVEIKYMTLCMYECTHFWCCKDGRGNQAKNPFWSGPTCEQFNNMNIKHNSNEYYKVHLLLSFTCSMSTFSVSLSTIL